MQTQGHPPREVAYLAQLRARLREALDEEMVGVYAGGSWALGDYLPGSSDLDVAVVVRGRLPGRHRVRLISRVSHDSLPCPARLLELVVYSRDVARSGSAACVRLD